MLLLHMNPFFKYRRSVAVTVLIFSGLLIFERCMNNGTETAGSKKPVFSQFAGSASCAGCHKEICNNHLGTAHYLTSGVADKNSIKGSFDTGKNIFQFAANTVVAMEKRKDSFFQVEYLAGREAAAYPFNVVIGSGTKGQTYLHWNKDRLFQLPITYFTAANEWCNSPGYPGKVVFNRPVTSRCLECHSTFAEPASTPDKQPEAFNRNTMIYGVDCEKCHGPGAEHVVFQTKNPGVKTAKFIINPASLSRQQNLDLCILCHGGRLQKTKPSFSFKVGDAITDYFALNDAVPQFASEIDVHGNQYGLMAASKCFMKSNTMTCNTCHNTHINEAGKTAVFSQRCISCHNTEHVAECKMRTAVGDGISSNCIDCHMPLEQSRAIVVLLPGNDVPTPAKMRSHYIKIYPNETKKFIEQMKSSANKK